MPLSPIEIGRVCLINYGPDAGKLCTVLDVVDSSSCLIDGPSNLTGVSRQTINLRRLSVTPIKVVIGRGARQKSLNKAWNKADVQNKWDSSAWAKRLARQKRRKNLTDFERFHVMVLRKKRSFAVGKEFKKLKKAARK